MSISAVYYSSYLPGEYEGGRARDGISSAASLLTGADFLFYSELQLDPQHQQSQPAV